MLIVVKGDSKGVQKLKSLGFQVIDLDKNKNAIDLYYEKIDQEDEIIFWYPASEHRKIKQFVRRVGRWRSKAIKGKMPSTLTDEQIHEAIKNAEEWKIRGLVLARDIGVFDPSQQEFALSSIAEFNQRYRGYAMGKLTIWTGIRGSGKSTFISQEVLSAIENDYQVFWYSAELTCEETLYWLELQAAGLGHIDTLIDENGAEYEKVRQDVQQKIREWVGDKIVFYDKEDVDEDDNSGIFELMLEAHRKYNCRIFVVDNLMTASYSGEIDDLDSDFYRAQTRFVKKLKDFATVYNVHVHLIAHPKKTDELGLVTHANQIFGGTGIPDLADSIYSINKIEPGSEAFKQIEEQGIPPCDAIMIELKSRFRNQGGLMIALNFDKKTRRFYQTDEERFRLWGWVNKGPSIEEILEINTDNDVVNF